jgi:hypothetical protein
MFLSRFAFQLKLMTQKLADDWQLQELEIFEIATYICVDICESAHWYEENQGKISSQFK